MGGGTRSGTRPSCPSHLASGGIRYRKICELYGKSLRDDEIIKGTSSTMTSSSP
ncbi:hypothetical protein [Streptomyces sp. NPDC002187]|uniref:hypothetical protein n=1 Tax=Streptomyces sp. NPDC002187 TaxID=3364637 RepID=UPI003674C2EE